MLSADSDDRVDRMHARKFVAAMQSVASDRPVLLEIRRWAGHFGADSVNLTVETEAEAAAFLLAEMDIQ